MTSEDVIHSFFVPAFRVKQDVVPGPLHARSGSRPTKPGRVPPVLRRVLRHRALADDRRVVVMEPAEYQAWLAGGPARRVAGGRGREALQRARLRHLPPRRRAGARGPALRRRLRPARCTLAERRATVDRRRGLPPRVDPRPRGEGRRRLPADHADLPGPGQRGGARSQLIAYIKSLQARRDGRGAGRAAEAQRAEHDSR